MIFSLLSRLELRQKPDRVAPNSGLEGLSDWLLRDIGYSADGRPLDPDTGVIQTRPTSNPILQMAPALLLISMH
jgi:hypothetical protein